MWFLWVWATFTATQRSDVYKRQVIYGAAAQNRFHVNFLPETPEERAKCEVLMAEWAARAAADRGQIITENGAGLLTRELALRFVRCV